MSALAVVSEGEEEVELSLGLSIGGCFRKPHKAGAGDGEGVFRKAVSVSSPRSSEADLECVGAEQQQVARSDGSALVDAESCAAADDLFKRRKELHALRRQEARKKRDVKQQKRGLARRNGFLANGHAPAAAGDDRHLLEAQELQCRLRDRAVKEIEASWADRVCKKEKDDGCGGVIMTAGDHNRQPASNPNTTSSSSSSAPFPVMPMQYPFQPVQYMPYGGGLSFPYMMPCWGPPPLPPPAPSAAEGLPADKNIFQPVALRPLQSHAPAHNANLLPGHADQNCGKGGASSGSQGSSASLVSDSHSASLQGGSCSETKSYRSRSPAEQTDSHVSLTPNAKAQSEYGDSTTQNDSLQTEAEATDKSPASKSSRGRPEEATVTAVPFTSSPPPPKSPPCERKPASPPLAPPEGAKETPPRTALLPQMPCVSTTGNGPNGKTIMGFLYRYTKSEVSIVCVCHGTSFSPAEFVKHAGGTDVSQPLKHIIVVPSAFG